MTHPIPISLVDNTFLIDNSSLETITTCPRSAEYYINLKRESSKSRPALEFGKIIHKILEARYREFPNQPITEAVKARMLQVALAEFTVYSPPEDDYRNYGMAVDIIDEYSKTYSVEPFEVLKLPDGQPAVEIGFAHPLGKLTLNENIYVRELDGTIVRRHVDILDIVWKGRIDLPFMRDGRLGILDHKTTSMMGPSYFKEFELSSQFKGYAWATSQLFGVNCETAVINAIAARKPTKTGKKIELLRGHVSFTPDLLTEWQHETLSIIENYIHNCMRGFLPRHTKWCVGKYGECQFFNVCSLPADQRAMMLATGDYKTVTWDPLNESAN